MSKTDYQKIHCAEYQKKYYKEHLDKLREYNRDYMIKYRRKKKWKAYLSEYKTKNHEFLNEKNKAYYHNNKAACKKRWMRWYIKHHEEIRIRARKRYWENRDAVLARQRELRKQKV